jgi:biopolymer transport protein ExbD
MAGIDNLGGRGSARDLNRDLPLVPFIDFLLCLIAFLLVTAVWSQKAQIDTNAQVPGQPVGPPPEQPKQLHVEVRDNSFELVWRQGATVISTNRVERRAVKVGEDVRYPELARRIAEEWQRFGDHRNANDPKLDRAVVHTSNVTEFGDLVAVLDAIRLPSRDFGHGAARGRVPAFSVSFAAN